MNEIHPPIINCSICRHEIPLDAAFTPEGATYVEHFCGLDCYAFFRAKAAAKSAKESTPPNATDHS